MCSIDEVANYMEVGWFIRLFEEIKDCVKTHSALQKVFFCIQKKILFKYLCIT